MKKVSIFTDRCNNTCAVRSEAKPGDSWCTRCTPGPALQARRRAPAHRIRDGVLIQDFKARFVCSDNCDWIAFGNEQGNKGTGNRQTYATPVPFCSFVFAFAVWSYRVVFKSKNWFQKSTRVMTVLFVQSRTQSLITLTRPSCLR